MCRLKTEGPQMFKPFRLHLLAISRSQQDMNDLKRIHSLMPLFLRGFAFPDQKSLFFNIEISMSQSGLECLLSNGIKVRTVVRCKSPEKAYF